MWFFEGSGARSCIDQQDFWSLQLKARENPNLLRSLPLELHDHRLFRLFRPFIERQRDQALVVGQLGQSLDGRIATQSGDSFYVNGPEGLDHLHRLRAMSDAVVVGVGTAIADNPRLTVRRCAGPSPARVVLDPRGRLPETSRLLARTGQDVLVMRGPAAPAAPEPAITVRLAVSARGCFDPRDIINELVRRGFLCILVEGGAVTVSRFVEDGVLDRLHMTVSTMLIGSGRSGLDLSPIDRLDGALRPSTSVHVLGEKDVLFDCAFDRSPGQVVTKERHRFASRESIKVAALP